MEEEDIVRKALSPSSKKGCHRKIPFLTTEKLIDDLTMLYPTVNEIAIYNHDLRDRAGGPVLTCKNHRALKAVITTTNRGYRGLDAKWQICFAAVENGMAYIRLTQLNIDGIS